VPELRPTNKKKDLDDKLKLNNKNTRDIKPKTGRVNFCFKNFSKPLTTKRR